MRTWLVVGFVLFVALGSQTSGAVPAGAGGTYSFAQMEQALEAAHVPPPGAAVGAAVAEAESGGSSTAVGDYGTSYGPWQIHLPDHPDVTIACAEDLACAAQVAARISSGGTDWSAWTTYRSGAYLTHLETRS
jgi:Lysozyme like domain